MLEVPVYNTDGKQIDTLKVDPAALGGEVNADLLKQAVVTYQANARQGSASNKNRALVKGTRQKMYRQKGTGNARHGNRQANLLRGGGLAKAKSPRDFSKKLPQKMRRAALNSAILAKIMASDLCIIDGLAASEPKTKTMAGLLKNLQIDRRCLLAMADRDQNIYLSSRNIPDLTVRITEELNAYDVASRPKMIVTSEAAGKLLGQEAK